MKLLVILNDLDIGGAQNYTISLMNEFVDIGHNVELRILSNNIPLKDRLCGKINLKIWGRNNKLDLKVLLKIRNEIKSQTYDCIISSYIIYMRLATIFLRRLPLTIFPIHSTIPRDKKISTLNYINFKFKGRNEIFLTSVDNQTKYLMEKYRLNNEFFEQIYNGVDTSRFVLAPKDFNREEFLQSKGISSSTRIILMVAGFRKEKRHIDAIDAFNLLMQKELNISLVFVGDNRVEELSELKIYSEKAGSKNTHFYTASTAGDVRYFYWSSDIFTLTSDQVETFPISSLEAMASGLPCVLTNVGGAKDIISENKNGNIVDPNDIVSISNGWEKCLSMNSNSRNLAIRENITANYSIRTSANKYLELIKRNNVNK